MRATESTDNGVKVELGKRKNWSPQTEMGLV
jgi:hypothetical protein